MPTFEKISENKVSSAQTILRPWRARCLTVQPAARLIGVSKHHPAAAVAPFLAAGLTDLGENYVQEAAPKFDTLKKAGHSFHAHLIGALQSNKAREAVATFDTIHTVNRPKIVHALDAACAAQGKRIEIFVQLNLGDEASKSGASVEALPALVEAARVAAHLDLAGLMAVPPEGRPPAPYFAFLAELARRFGLSRLSMGMSGDADVALRLGATDIRIGTALFGARDAA